MIVEQITERMKPDTPICLVVGEKGYGMSHCAVRLAEMIEVKK